MGGCLLAQDTREHREIFGPDLGAVVYFGSIPQMQARALWLLEREAERQRLAHAACARITRGANSYADRLRWILRQLGF